MHSVVVYKTSSGVVISYKFLNSFTSIPRYYSNYSMIWKVWVLDTCYKLLNTDTWLVLASCRVTQYSGKVDLTEYLFCNSNTRYVFSIQQRYLWTISPLSSYLDTRFVYIQQLQIYLRGLEVVENCLAPGLLAFGPLRLLITVGEIVDRMNSGWWKLWVGGDLLGLMISFGLTNWFGLITSRSKSSSKSRASFNNRLKSVRSPSFPCPFGRTPPKFPLVGWKKILISIFYL